MAKIKFLIRGKAKNQPARIFLRIYQGRSFDYSFPTNNFTFPEYWNPEKEAFFWKKITSNYFQYKEIEKNLNDLKAKILNEFAGNSIPTIEEIKNIITAFENPGQTQKELDLNYYLDRYILEMESGKRLTENKNRFQKGTIKNYKSFQAQFDAFQIAKNIEINFENVTLDFYGEYVQFLTKKLYAPNTIGKHIKHIKTIMRSSLEEGLHKNTEFQRRLFKAPSNKTVDIYLTEKELKKLHQLKLTGVDAVARDIFLIGCYTAQRYSDFSKIKPENIKGNTIQLTQQKTGATVVIPMRPEVKAILKKYEYTVPKSHAQKINDRIKTIGEKAGITELIEVEKVNGGLKIKTLVPKCKMIKTHTGRRTGATNMYLAGISTIAIMKITGHKTAKEFMKYIKISSEESANKLLTHPYFTQKKMKVVKS